VIGFSQSAAREAKKWISQQDPFVGQISTLDAEFPDFGTQLHGPHRKM
jgi:hypothetical protein